jgi:DNA-binding beta-propeller fold protein YncE
MTKTDQKGRKQRKCETGTVSRHSHAEDGAAPKASPDTGPTPSSAWLFIPLLLVWLVPACGPSSDSGGSSVDTGPAVCPDGPRRPEGSVDPGYATLGPTSNAIRQSDEHLWVVESGANTVSRLSVESGDFDSGFIDVGNGRNPYDVAVDSGEGVAWVTNNLEHTVTVADTGSGEVLAEIDGEAFDNPAGIALTDERAWVTNFELDGREFGTGSLAVVDRETREVVASFDTEWKNPVYARPIETPDGPRVAITDAGVLEQQDGSWGPQSPAGLELWRPDADLESPARQTFELGFDAERDIGAPGRPLPAPDGRHLYFASADAPVLFKFDLAEGAWDRGIEDPIELYETDDDALHHAAFGPDGLLYVTAYNQDAMYLVDPSCDEPLGGPIDLGTTDELLEGPHGVAVRPRGDRRTAYYIMSQANSLGRVELTR